LSRFGISENNKVGKDGQLHLLGMQKDAGKRIHRAKPSIQQYIQSISVPSTSIARSSKQILALRMHKDYGVCPFCQIDVRSYVYCCPYDECCEACYLNRDAPFFNLPTD